MLIFVREMQIKTIKNKIDNKYTSNVFSLNSDKLNKCSKHGCLLMNINLKFKEKPKLEKPKSFITKEDTKIVYRALLISVMCCITILDPFSCFHKALNTKILEAIPLEISIPMLFLPVFIYYGIISMERCYFRELIKQESRRLELFKKRQKIHFTARYREKKGGAYWELTNRSSFSWTNSKFFIERTYNGKIKTEKHQLDIVPTLKRISIDSKLESFPGSQWRIMVLSEEGHTIDFPERQEKLAYL